MNIIKRISRLKAYACDIISVLATLPPWTASVRS